MCNILNLCCVSYILHILYLKYQSLGPAADGLVYVTFQGLVNIAFARSSFSIVSNVDNRSLNKLKQLSMRKWQVETHTTVLTVKFDHWKLKEKVFWINCMQAVLTVVLLAFQCSGEWRGIYQLLGKMWGEITCLLVFLQQNQSLWILHCSWCRKLVSVVRNPNCDMIDLHFA